MTNNSTDVITVCLLNQLQTVAATAFDTVLFAGEPYGARGGKTVPCSAIPAAAHTKESRTMRKVPVALLLLAPLSLMVLPFVGCAKAPNGQPAPLQPAAPPSAPEPTPARNWLPYAGAFFEIQYPEGFTVGAQERSLSSPDSFDGASFVSPDGQVEFYVFSPQWSGQSAWINPRAGEKVVEDRNETQGEETIRHVTLEGPKGRRSYKLVRNQTDHTMHILGISYRNPEALERYAVDWERFRGTLRQFAD